MNTKEELQENKALKAICKKIIEYEFFPELDFDLHIKHCEINELATNIKQLLTQDITKQLTKLFDIKIKLHNLVRLTREAIRKERKKHDDLGIVSKDLEEYFRDSNAYNEKVQQAIDIEKTRLEKKYNNLFLQRLGLYL